jgi:hypothetical protein
MKVKNVLIVGNKQYYNFNLNNIVDSFDIIYRFNMCFPGNNNGTKFGKLAMCNHVYHNCITNPMSKQQLIQKYSHELEMQFLSDWYDFFQENKQNFDDIFHENAYNWGTWNQMLEKYGSPHRFSKMASSGYSVIFRNLLQGNKVYVFGFTLCDEEVRKTTGEIDEVVKAKNKGFGSHSFTDERDILAWLHNNNIVDASLCMIEDTNKLNLKTNKYNTKPSEFILDLLNRKKTI